MKNVNTIYPMVSMEKSCEQKHMEHTIKVIMESETCWWTSWWFCILLAFSIVIFLNFLLYALLGLTIL